MPLFPSLTYVPLYNSQLNCRNRFLEMRKKQKGRWLDSAESPAFSTSPVLYALLSRYDDVFTQQRSTSATLHACATQPRGV
jgi:hypothetical protein